MDDILARNYGVTYRNVTSRDFQEDEEDAIFTQPESGRTPVLQFINSATKTLDINIFTLYDSEIENALINLKTLREKITIRVIIPWNYINKKFTLPQNLKNLKNRGIKINFSPIQYFNSHSKYMIVDNKKCMIFDFNFYPVYFSKFRGFGFITYNKTVVDEVVKVFNYDYYKNVDVSLSLTSSQLVWSPNSQAYNEAIPQEENGIHKIYNLIYRAESTIDLYSFILTDKNVQDRLIRAAEGGVSVRILFNANLGVDSTFSLSVLKNMINSGIKLKYYSNPSTPFNPVNPNNLNPNYEMHSKCIICDKQKMYLGSLNLNFASIYANRETGIIIDKENLIRTVSETFEKDWNSSYAKEANVDTRPFTMITDPATLEEFAIYGVDDGVDDVMQ